MPRKVGYGTFTPARKAALKKAQLESARKRRKGNSFKRSNRKKRNIALGAAAVAGAAAIGVGLYAKAQADNKERGERLSKLEKEIDEETAKNADIIQEGMRRKQMDQQAAIKALKIAAGNVAGEPKTQEEYDARVKLYGKENIIGEFSAEHQGRPEIFPGRPIAEVARIFQEQQYNPSHRIELDNPDEDFVYLYHRTGGGTGPRRELEAQQNKESLLKEQTMRIQNRDEIRVSELQPQNQAIRAAVNNNLSYWSNRLNDSNTRNAFGEHVVKVKVPKEMLRGLSSPVQQVSFGELAPNNEVWAAIPPDALKGLTIEDVLPDEITEKPKRFIPR